MVDLHGLRNILVRNVKSVPKRGCSSLTPMSPSCYKACYEGYTKGQAGCPTRDLIDRSRKTRSRYFWTKKLNKGWCVNIWRQKSSKLDFIFGERATALVPWWYVEQADEVSKHDSCRLLNGQLGSQATCRANKQLQCFIIFGFCTEMQCSNCRNMWRAGWP